MSNFFRFFPLRKYKFGDEESLTSFQQLNVYVDLIDQVKDIATFYQIYHVQEFERPDTLSYKLYGTSNYAWTFYLLNEKLRLQGWPMSNLDLYRSAKEYYPNIVLYTDQNLSYTGNIKVGDTVQSFTNSSQTGIVRKIDYNLGQIVIERNSTFSPQINGYIIKQGAELDINLAVKYTSQVRQYEAVHHYEYQGQPVDYLDSAGAQSSIETLTFKNTTGLDIITNIERLRNLNIEQKKINVFKPNLIEKVVSEFNSLIEYGDRLRGA